MNSVPSAENRRDLLQSHLARTFMLLPAPHLTEPMTTDQINQQLDALDLENIQHFGHDYPCTYYLIKKQDLLPGEILCDCEMDDPDYKRLCELSDRQG